MEGKNTLENTEFSNFSGYSPAPDKFPATPPPQYGAQPPLDPVGQPAQPVMAQPPMGAPPMMVPGVAVSRPQTHLLVSVVACLFCFWPTGIVAIIHSLEVDNRYLRGDYQGAMESSMKAYRWAKISILVGVIITCVFGGLMILYTIFNFALISSL